MKKKATKVTPKTPTKDAIIYQNGVLLNENAAIVSELALLRAQVVQLQSQLAAANVEADALAEALNAGKHKKPGHCKHCGRQKIDHFYYTAKCKPHGDVAFEEVK